MSKKLLQIFSITASLFLFSCAYHNCDEDCALGAAPAMCPEHPKEKCNCFDKFDLGDRNTIYKDDQNTEDELNRNNGQSY
ncbi:MAG: hypothetical protein NE330_07715 [Lentisphaeraceae bacterium]|nr:hypothetical protein [Lentisphaeraceae bacterium]